MVNYYGSSIFCEDVRIEASGQRTYIGVFPQQITIDEDLPITIPPLCIANHFSITINKPKIEPKFIVTLKEKSGREEILFEDTLPELPYSKKNKGKAIHTLFHIYLDAFEITETSRITASLSVDEVTFTTGTCVIRTRPPQKENETPATE